MNRQTMCTGRIFLLVTIFINPYAFHTFALKKSNESTKVVRVFTIGDSTMADYTSYPTKSPMFGWGQVFQDYFNTEKLIVSNHGRSGRSCKTYISDGFWNTVLSQISPDDYVFIQFGHNDEKDSSLDEYRLNLSRFINETRKKGAIPVLLTPTTRRTFNSNGTLYDSHIKDGNDYPSTMRKLAADSAVLLIDITASSMELVETLGIEGSKIIYLWLKPGESSNYPNGSSDNTHFSEYGANEMAKLVVIGIKESNLQLATALNDFSGITQNYDSYDVISLYQNVIQVSVNSENALFQLINANGHLLKSVNISKDINKIDISGLNKGLYIAYLLFDNKIITSRIILR